MPWIEHQIKSFSDFSKFIDELLDYSSLSIDWYYRGQSNKNWDLVPSINRLFNDVSLNIERAIGIESGSTRRFQSKFHLQSGTNSHHFNTSSIVAWWAIMQHYGCPTRLLDWTLSPFVALYFAIESQLTEDGCVWLLPANALETQVTQKYGTLPYDEVSVFESSSGKAIYPIEATMHNERSAAQQGVFTICTNILCEHTTAIEEAFEDQANRYPLHKIIIEANVKGEILFKLQAMNVFASSLFPGLDGIGRSSKEYVQMRMWHTKNENEKT